MPQKRTIPRVCEQCGEEFVAKKQAVKEGRARFCSKSCSSRAMPPEQRSGWKGGIRRIKGYIGVYAPDHPAANANGYVMQHRLVMERELGRPLLPTEVVHHLPPGMKTDNRPWNLMVTTISEHAKIHLGKGDRWARDFDHCRSCGKSDSPHQGHGLCARCYYRKRRKEQHER